MLRLVKGLNTDSKDIEGGRSITGSDGKLCLSKKETLEGLYGKDHELRN